MPEDDDPVNPKRSLRDYGFHYPTLQDFVAIHIGILLFVATFILVALLESPLQVPGWLSTPAVLVIPSCLVAAYAKWVFWRRDKGYWL
jgi:hypothetical protein